jgi:hypothetical protein
VKRSPPSPRRTDWGFDQKQIQDFLEFMAKRVTVEPPQWWRATMVKGEVFPNRHHAFIDIEGDLPAAPKVDVEKGEVTITSGNQSIKLGKAVYDGVFTLADIGTRPWCSSAPSNRSLHDLWLAVTRSKSPAWTVRIGQSRRDAPVAVRRADRWMSVDAGPSALGSGGRPGRHLDL